MSYLVVPHEASATSAGVWLAAWRDAPAALELAVGDRPPMPVNDEWTVWQAHGRPALWCQRLTVEGLEAGRRYPLRLLAGGLEVASGTAATLPARLPTIAETPFVCLLGSCFAHFNDGAGAAGRAYAALPAGARPQLKFLCGDQVYLDAPFPRYLYNVYAEDELQAQLLNTYLETWAQGGDGRGFAELLRSGANYFTSDDHEVWNNAPSATPVVRATWWPFGDRGAAWKRIATALYDDIQTPRRSTRLRLGRLSVLVLDVRLGRSRDRSRFTTPEELEALDEWVAGLDGPGALVLGQPIFVRPVGIKGHVTDWGLADFEQYAELVRSLSRSAHDLLVLTGDVHYGRVAGCTLPSGASLIEVIASPFALVDTRVGGRWSGPPEVFPAAPVGGVVQSPIWVEAAHVLASNQFATLEFAADGSRVRATVRAWAIPEPGRAPTSTTVMQRLLQ